MFRNEAERVAERMSTPIPLVSRSRVLRRCHVDVETDKLLQYPSRTPDLYEAKIAPLVEKTMNGFNSTIFA